MASSTKQQEPSGIQVRVIGLVPMMDVELGLATGFGVGLSTELAGVIAESQEVFTEYYPLGCLTELGLLFASEFHTLKFSI